MTNPDDLIRRGDLKTRVDLFAALMIGAGYAEFANASRKMVLEIMADIPISALPAVAASQPADPVRVTVKPLVWEESLKGRWIGTAPSECGFGSFAFWIFADNHRGFVRHKRNGEREFHPTLEAAKAAAQADYDARILAAIDVPPAPQCCMCGKRGLSTAEDGGPECELHDGRWTCSRKCYDAACSLMVPPIDVQPDTRDAQIAALVEAAEHLLNAVDTFAETPPQSTSEALASADVATAAEETRAAIAAVKGGDA